MKFSAWATEDESGWVVIEGTDLSARPDLTHNQEPQFIKQVFEAESWNDAMTQYHEWQGWEPYKPMPE